MAQFPTFIPSGYPVPTSAPLPLEAMMPLILSRFDAIERMVLGLYSSRLNPPNDPPYDPHGPGEVHSKPASAPRASRESKSDDQSSVRPRKPIPIIAPSSPELSPRDTPEPRDCDVCHKPFNPTNPKWKVCFTCDEEKRQDVRAKKLKRGKVPCDTADCPNTVSPQSASGLCHVCWWKTHIKCHFCPGTLRSSEESHVCGRCRQRFRNWHRISGKKGYRVCEQSGQVGRLFVQGGRFQAFEDQEEATAKLANYREFIRVTGEDEVERSNSASRRRAERVKEKENTAEKALSRWKSGLEVTFVPTESEALTDANASCPEETSVFPVEFTPHHPNVPGMSARPRNPAGKTPPTFTPSRPTEAEFPFSDGKYHAMLTKHVTSASEVSSDCEVPSGAFSRNTTAGPEVPALSTNHLLPASEVFVTSRPGAAIPIVAPTEELVTVPFLKSSPTAVRDKPTSVSPPIAKDREAGSVTPAKSSAPLPALDTALTIPSKKIDTPVKVVAAQLPFPEDNSVVSLKGEAPKAPRLPQPSHTAAIHAGTPSNAELSTRAKKPVVFVKNADPFIMGGNQIESDQVTKSKNPELYVVPSSTTPITKPTTSTESVDDFFDTLDDSPTPPVKLITPPSARQAATHCSGLCSQAGCLRTGFDSACVRTDAHLFHSCDLCFKSSKSPKKVVKPSVTFSLGSTDVRLKDNPAAFAIPSYKKKPAPPPTCCAPYSYNAHSPCGGPIYIGRNRMDPDGVPVCSDHQLLKAIRDSHFVWSDS